MLTLHIHIPLGYNSREGIKSLLMYVNWMIKYEYAKQCLITNSHSTTLILTTTEINSSPVFYAPETSVKVTAANIMSLLGANLWCACVMVKDKGVSR